MTPSNGTAWSNRRAACGSRPSRVNVAASGRPGRLSMTLIFAGAALVIIGVVFMATQPLWRGRLSREPEAENAHTLSPRASNTLEPRRPARGLGMKFNWPGLVMVAAGFLLCLSAMRLEEVAVCRSDSRRPRALKRVYVDAHSYPLGPAEAPQPPGFIVPCQPMLASVKIQNRSPPSAPRKHVSRR